MGLMFDCETNDYALSDCAWWDQPINRRPWWAKRDCSGRVGDTEVGVICEGHHNAGFDPITQRLRVSEPETEPTCDLCPNVLTPDEKDGRVCVHHDLGPLPESIARNLRWLS